MASGGIKKKVILQGMRKRSASVVSMGGAESVVGSPEFQAYLRAISSARTAKFQPSLVPDGEDEGLQSRVRLRSYSESSQSVSSHKIKDKATSVLKTIPEKFSEAKPKARRASVSLAQNLTKDFTFFEEDTREDAGDNWSSTESLESGEVEITDGNKSHHGESSGKNVEFGPVQSTEVEVFVWLPDGKRVTLTGQPGMTVKELVADVTMEYRIPRHMLRRASTLGIVHEDEKVSSIARQEIIIESRCVEETEEDADKRLAVLNEIISSERVYCNLLQSIFMTYKDSLSKLSSMPKSDHTRIFSSVEQMVTISATFLTQLEQVSKSWNSYTATIGHLFDEEFLEEYKEYYAHFRVMRLLLIFLRNNNKDFVNLCREKRGKSWHTLESLLLLPDDD